MNPMTTYRAQAHGADTSVFTVDLTDDEYRAVLKFVHALNHAWQNTNADVPSINIEKVTD